MRRRQTQSQRAMCRAKVQTTVEFEHFCPKNTRQYTYRVPSSARTATHPKLELREILSVTVSQGFSARDGPSFGFENVAGRRTPALNHHMVPSHGQALVMSRDALAPRHARDFYFQPRPTCDRITYRHMPREQKRNPHVNPSIKNNGGV